MIFSLSNSDSLDAWHDRTERDEARERRRDGLEAAVVAVPRDEDRTLCRLVTDDPEVNNILIIL
jgi:hypothetical protein